MEQRVRKDIQEVLKEAESVCSDVSNDVQALRDAMVKNVVTGASAAAVVHWDQGCYSENSSSKGSHETGAHPQGRHLRLQ